MTKTKWKTHHVKVTDVAFKLLEKESERSETPMLYLVSHLIRKEYGVKKE